MKRILVIEDEPAIRLGMVRLLLSHSFNVVEAEDGEMGLLLSKRFCLSCRQEMPNFSELNSSDKVLTPVFAESKGQSPQKAYFNDSLDTFYQSYKTLKPTFVCCSLKPSLAASF